MKRATQASKEILDAAGAAAVDVDALVSRTDAVLAEPLHWFPIRHHSPRLAQHVRDTIRARKPLVVFIEGPFEAQHTIDFLVDRETKPPVAIYSSFRLDPPPSDAASGAPADAAPRRLSAWYPLVGYSPEFVAMQTAREVGAEAVFIDLPHYAMTIEASTPTGDDPSPRGRRGLDEIGPASGLYERLAQAAGRRDWNETWDRLFESPREGRTTDSLRRDVALFCAAVRATTPPRSLEIDGTLARERFMLRTIRETLAVRGVDPRRAIVVCGGFHIFMDQRDATPPPPIPSGQPSVTVTPYSYFRISELSGYGAGNRAPRFYEMCHDFDHAGRGRDELLIEYVVDVLKEARRDGESLSAADAIGVTQHAQMLGALRGSRTPVLDDIQDALVTCCCKGDPRTDATRLLAAIDEVNIGTRLGRVTDRVGRLPIVGDFHAQLASLELEHVAAREKLVLVTLDKRRPADAARSAFLHRLIFLGVEIGAVQRESAPFAQSVFKEHWRLKWSPRIEPSLIERSLHGDTVEAAATTLLRESLGAASGDAGASCRRLVQAVDMDLPRLVAQADVAAGRAVDRESRFHSLAEAFTALMMLERYAAYRGLGKERLTDLLGRCFARACWATPAVACAPPEQWDEVIAGLLALAEPVVQRQDLDAALFASNVESAARASTMPFLRGAFMGVLTEIRCIKPDAVATELLGYARGAPDRQVVAGDFLNGVLKVSRTAVLLGAGPLVAAIDELLRTADAETFLSMVPRLRGAFEGLHTAQRDAVAARVAELYRVKEGESLSRLATSFEAARLMAELDAQVARIMDEWDATT